MHQLTIAFSLFLYFPSFGQELNFHYSHGTSIIAFVRQDSVWIAADTKIIANSAPYIEKRRKIFRTGDVYFAIAGLHKAKNMNGDRVIFDAYEVANYFIKKFDGNMKDITKGFIDSTCKVLTTLKVGIPAVFNLEIILVKMEQSGPLFKHITLGKQCDNGSCKVVALPVETSDNNDEFYMIGAHEHYKKFLYNNPSYFRDLSNIKDKLVCLIKIEADNDPGVGMPVDVLLLHKKGHKWYLDNSACKDQGISAPLESK